MQSQTSKSQPQNSKDENVALSEQGNQSETTQYSEDPAQVEAILIPHLEKMLELENVKSQKYLINRLNSNLEIRVSLIFKERSVQAITQDYRILESALQKCKNIEYLPEIKSIRLKSTVERKTILVKGIPLAKETDFNKFIDNLCEKDEKTKQYKFSYDKKTECASLTFPDETSTIKIFSELMNIKFQENQIDCIIKDSNAFIEILEATKNSQRGGGGMGVGGGYYPYQPSYYPPFQPGYYPKQMYNYSPYQQQMPMMMPPTNFPTGGYYPNYNQGGWNSRGGYRGNSGYQYRNNKPYYNRKYNEGTEGKFDEGDQVEEGAEQEEKTEYRSERREYRGDRRGGRGGYNRRGNYQDRKQHRSKEEMEKITSLDPENYPPLS